MNLRDKIADLYSPHKDSGRKPCRLCYEKADAILSLVAEEMGKIRSYSLVPGGNKYIYCDDVLALLRGGEHE